MWPRTWPPRPRVRKGSQMRTGWKAGEAIIPEGNNSNEEAEVLARRKRGDEGRLVTCGPKRRE